MSRSDEQRLSVKYSSASSSASEIDTSATVAVAPYAMAVVLSFVVVIVRGEKNNASVGLASIGDDPLRCYRRFQYGFALTL